MRTRYFLATPLIALLALHPSGVISQGVAPPPAATTAAPPGAGDLGFDDLMSILIQPRHIKLYYAGVKKNWELAAAESRDLRSGLARMSQRIPKYLSNDVAETVRTMIEPQLQAIDAAIAAADPKRFAAAYADLTTACNACHTYMEHPFIIIKTPDPNKGSPYPDQVFD